MAPKAVSLRAKLLKKKVKAMATLPIIRLNTALQEFGQRLDQLRQLPIAGVTDADFNEITLLINGLMVRVTTRLVALGLQAPEVQLLTPFTANSVAATQLMYSAELELLFGRITSALFRVDGQTLGQADEHFIRDSLRRIVETRVWTSLDDPKSDSGRGWSDASTPTSDSN